MDQPLVMGGAAMTLSTPTLLLTEARWQRIAALLPPPKQGGRPMVDSYPLLAGILWIMRTGSPWRELPVEFGHWHTAYTRYHDWQCSGLWTQILAILAAPESDHTPELSL
jgi:transposase